MQIQFGTTTTPIGEITVAYTDRGVCSVTIGDDRATLESELRAQFAAAELRRAPAEDPRVSSIAAAIACARTADVPLDLDGTDFQLRVWQALRRIPRGETRSYQEVAKSIGRPTATRAVAGACASNQIAVMVPCHRVVRGDGSLGGYRWGVDRKQRLLDQESGTSKP